MGVDQFGCVYRRQPILGRATGHPPRCPSLHDGALRHSIRGALNEKLASLGEHRSGYFNGIQRHHLRTECAAAALREYIMAHRLDRLVAGSDQGATPEQVAEAWCEIERDREAALRWAREGAAGGRARVSVRAAV